MNPFLALLGVLGGLGAAAGAGGGGGSSSSDRPVRSDPDLSTGGVLSGEDGGRPPEDTEEDPPVEDPPQPVVVEQDPPVDDTPPAPVADSEEPVAEEETPPAADDTGGSPPVEETPPSDDSDEEPPVRDTPPADDTGGDTPSEDTPPADDAEPVAEEETPPEDNSGPVEDETPVNTGTPVVFLMGQSNALFIAGSGAVEDSLADIGSDAEVVVVADGGVSVTRPDGAWNVITGDGSDEPGRLYSEFLDAVDDIRAEIPDAYIAGAIWVHGETDAYFNSPYYETTRPLFELMHEETGEEFPIAIVGLSDFHDVRVESRENIQDDQMQLAEDLDYVTFIDTNAIAAENNLGQSDVMMDALHYSEAFRPLIAQEAVGALFDIDQQDGSSSALTDSEELWLLLTEDQGVLGDSSSAEDEELDVLEIF